MSLIRFSDWLTYCFFIFRETIKKRNFDYKEYGGVRIFFYGQSHDCRPHNSYSTIVYKKDVLYVYVSKWRINYNEILYKKRINYKLPVYFENVQFLYYTLIFILTFIAKNRRKKT